VSCRGVDARSDGVACVGGFADSAASWEQAAAIGEHAADFDCLFFNQLPYCEDIRTYTFPSFASMPAAMIPTSG
jgi:hypothetical protein